MVRGGVRQVVVSPGSRSTPVVLALAARDDVEAIPVLDERSAGFFALGLARATGRVVALLCTSGSAAANYWPAVVEAHESGGRVSSPPARQRDRRESHLRRVLYAGPHTTASAW